MLYRRTIRRTVELRLFSHPILVATSINRCTKEEISIARFQQISNSQRGPLQTTTPGLKQQYIIAILTVFTSHWNLLKSLSWPKFSPYMWIHFYKPVFHEMCRCLVGRMAKKVLIWRLCHHVCLNEIWKSTTAAIILLFFFSPHKLQCWTSRLLQCLTL